MNSTTKSDIQKSFEGFHKDNPHIYTKLVTLSRAWKDSTGGKVGIGMLFEVLRWDSGITTRNDKFKLNNNYRSRYVRLIENNESDLRNMFRTRTLTADEA